MRRNHARPRGVFLPTLSLLAALVALAGACAEDGAAGPVGEQGLAIFSVTAVPWLVLPGEEVSFGVSYAAPGDAVVTWRFPDGGQLLESEGALAVWRVPVVPGTYLVRVDVESGGAVVAGHVVVSSVLPPGYEDDPAIEQDFVELPDGVLAGGSGGGWGEANGDPFALDYADEDGDGLDDAWEQEFLDGDPLLGDDGWLDPDGDGFFNEEEESLGTDPLDADDHPRPDLSRVFVDPVDARLWVVDSGTHRLYRLAPDGSLVLWRFLYPMDTRGRNVDMDVTSGALWAAQGYVAFEDMTSRVDLLRTNRAGHLSAAVTLTNDLAAAGYEEAWVRLPRSVAADPATGGAWVLTALGTMESPNPAFVQHVVPGGASGGGASGGPWDIENTALGDPVPGFPEIHPRWLRSTPTGLGVVADAPVESSRNTAWRWASLAADGSVEGIERLPNDREAGLSFAHPSGLAWQLALDPRTAEYGAELLAADARALRLRVPLGESEFRAIQGDPFTGAAWLVRWPTPLDPEDAQNVELLALGADGVATGWYRYPVEALNTFTLAPPPWEDTGELPPGQPLVAWSAVTVDSVDGALLFVDRGWCPPRSSGVADEYHRPYWVRKIGRDGRERVRVRFACDGTQTVETPPLPARPANAAPVFDSVGLAETLAVRTAAEGAVAVSDADGDAVRVVLVEAPDGCKLSADGATLAWTPATGQIGEHSIGLRALDDRGGVTVRSLAVTVTEADAVPPTALWAWGSAAGAVRVRFDEPVAVDSLAATAFSLDRGLAVRGATPAAPGADEVALDTDPQAPGAVYHLTVTGVTDLAGNPVAATTLTFAGYDATTEGMVWVPERAFFVDRYEAALDGPLGDDPTGTAAAAVSRPGAPATDVTYAQAAAACRNAGKRLCTSVEWSQACAGPENLRYGYGETWTAGAATDCHVLVERRDGPGESGATPACESAAGAFDLIGNVAEWVAGPLAAIDQPGGVMGGSFATPASFADCFHSAGWPDDGLTTDLSGSSPRVGFRCCADSGSGQQPAGPIDGVVVAAPASPDDETTDLFLLGEEGPLQLTAHPGWETWPTITPDRRWVVYVTAADVVGMNMGAAVVPATGGSARDLGAGAVTVESRLGVSPTSARAAFFGTENFQRQVMVVPLAGGAPWSVANGVMPATFPVSALQDAPVFTCDDEDVFFAGVRPGSGAPGASEIWSVAADGSQKDAPFQVTADGRPDYHPVPLTDCRVVWLADDSDPTNPMSFEPKPLYVMKLQGYDDLGNLDIAEFEVGTVSMGGPVQGFAVSPDDRLAALSLHDEDAGRDRVRLVDLATGEARWLPSAPGSADARWPVFAPDGSAVAYIASSRARTDVVVQPLEEGAPARWATDTPEQEEAAIAW